MSSSTDWKRQKVQDHKFDFIDVEDYLDNSLWRKLKYSLVFAVVIKGILIYCADLWTAVNLLVSGTWSNNLGVEHNQISFKNINISFEIYKWIFAACIILSFILLAWDMKKAVAIIASRDISYAFTSMIAYRYYAIKSYAHFCLFEKIHNSKKQIDEIAFFCFFTFRGWKRLMFADGPRQVINGIILITVANRNRDKEGHLNPEIWTYGFGTMPTITMGLMAFTLTLWVISVLNMLVAVFMYIPLVIHIQGNLKEFCCHKIDKRIDEIVKQKAKDRASEAAMNAKSGKGGEAPLPKATLPNISFMEEGGRSSSPAPPLGSKPRIPTAAGTAAPSPYMTPTMTATATASPAPRKKSPVTPANDPYRHHQQQQQQQQQHLPPQHPPRSFSPAPGRSYTPNSEDDTDSKPLRQDNYQQAYHNRNIHRQQQDPRYDNSDARSEISSSQFPSMPMPFNAHRRQQSDASTVLSGSNQGSVVNGQYPGSRPPVRPHPLQQQQLANNNRPYADSVQMSDLGRNTPNPYAVYQGQGQGQGRVTGLGGGVGRGGGNGSVVGGAHMRFILSALLATTLLATMATMTAADRQQGRQGQQAAFRLERRHDHHHKKIDHSHHHKSSSKKQRRNMDIWQQMGQDSEDSMAFPNDNIIVLARRATIAEEEKAMTSLHRKNKANHSHHKKGKKDHSHHKSSTCNHEKRALELHRKGKKNHSHHQHKKVDHSHHRKESSYNNVQKRAVPAEEKKVNPDEELAFHRKISRNRKTQKLGQGNRKKNQKRDVPDKKKKVNDDEELAFHRKISRNRKNQKLGQNRNNNNKRDIMMSSPPVQYNREYTIVRAQQEPEFKTQDIKTTSPSKKHHKTTSSRKSKKAQRKQKKNN
ncbi:hypothetical protein BGZ95_010924 [Linnemannia exigua]|uniref:Uncharacterized protein n=1 Tax=Linnemannia exigua TaxID=604196 RepID=A0AAD4H605_9FUNG|nr:hypothetical protein BGZ95_010924 [Linnemannia exigua]